LRWRSMRVLLIFFFTCWNPPFCPHPSSVENDPVPPAAIFLAIVNVRARTDWDRWPTFQNFFFFPPSILLPSDRSVLRCGWRSEVNRRRPPALRPCSSMTFTSFQSCLSGQVATRVLQGRADGTVGGLRHLHGAFVPPFTFF